MPKNREIVRGGPALTRIREGSRLMRTHESMVDYLSGRSSGGSFLEALAPALFGFHFPHSLEDDLMYSDDDDLYDDDDDNSHNFANKSLEPHPQIKELGEEEAKELIEEEEKRKERTERNKRKKKRKKEKKRLEKENALKENLPIDDEDELDSSKKTEQACIINDDLEKNEPPDSVETETQEAENTKEKENITINYAEEEHEDLNSNNLNAASSKLGSEENCTQMSRKEKKKEKNKIQQLEEENKEDAEKSEVQRKSEHESNKEKMRDPVSEEHAKRSIELASMGNRLAATGQYEMAVSCFTDAIKYNPKEFKLFGNRSLCYERLQQYENALRDADLALFMQPKWIKGLFRKGKALCGLKRYYEASQIYKDVLKLESTSVEAAQELKRAQTLHLMEMGFSWAQSTEALKTHQTLEKAMNTLFASKDPQGACAHWEEANKPPAKEDDDDDAHWTVLQTARPRTQQVRDLASLGEIRSKSQSPTPRSKNSAKHELFSVWVGTLGPTMTYTKLHELFSRVGVVCSIKMLLEQQCAFVNYTQKEECERAIQCIDGMVVEGAPLTVRYPFKNSNGEMESFQRSSTYKKECFFWRTSGCTRDDCTFRHIPEHKNIDRDKFTSRLGFGSHAGN